MSIEQKLIGLINGYIQAKNITVSRGGWGPVCSGENTDTYIGIEIGIGDYSKKNAITSKKYHIEIHKNDNVDTLVVFDKTNNYTKITDEKGRQAAFAEISKVIPDHVFVKYSSTAQQSLAMMTPAGMQATGANTNTTTTMGTHTMMQSLLNKFKPNNK